MSSLFSISHILRAPQGEAFLSGFHRRTYQKGGLISGGDRSDNGVFIVRQGRARVYLMGEEREITLCYLLPDDIFCFHSGCTIEAMETTVTAQAGLREIEKLLHEYPELNWKIFGVLGGAMLSSIRTIEGLVFQDVKQRLARFFLEQTASPGGGRVAEGQLPGPLTTEELAHVVGSSRQTTSTALNELIKEGLISRVGRGRYVTANRKNLARLASAGLPDAMSGDGHDWNADRL